MVMLLLGGLRSALMDNGVQSLMMGGAVMTLKLLAGSLDLQLKVKMK